MKISQLFTKSSKTVPADEISKNAQLLIQAGYIHKEMAGVYSYLPLGLRVIENIKKIIRQEMNSLGAQEIIMTTLQPKELWEETDRWDDEKVDIWFKSNLKNGTEVGFAWSHEEQITVMMKDFVSSYRDLPVNVYQFQTKLRNETRAKSGIMRTREFVMKDLYSYSRDEKEHETFYNLVSDAYLRVFDRVGLGKVTYKTFASGGAFTQFSHEFQTITEAGEDIIYVSDAKKIAINEEVYTPTVVKQLGIEGEELKKLKAAEVGNIFSFGDTKAKQLGLYYSNEKGEQQPVILGSYGIGVGRLMGVVVEHFADEKGLVWPEAIAPAKVYLICLSDSDIAKQQAETIDRKITEMGIEVLYDDRDIRAGEKFADADLLGIPYRLVISDKTISKQVVEVKERTKDAVQYISQEELLDLLSAKQ